MPKAVTNAYRYFEDHAKERDLLGIEIVDGDCPGSSYFAAELHIDVDEANLRARIHKLPYRFREAY